MYYFICLCLCVVFNAQRISENPLRNIVFPEYCGDQSSIPQDKICDVYITIPSNAIIYQRNIEGECIISVHVCMYVPICKIICAYIPLSTYILMYCITHSCYNPEKNEEESIDE